MSGLVESPLLRRGALAGAVIIALVLLAVFHSVVAGAVQRAAQRRSDALSEAVALHSAPPATRAVHAAYFPSRRISLARAGD